MIGPALAALFLAGSAAPISPELKELVTELASNAYAVGACERYIPNADGNELVGSFSDLDGRPGRNAAEDLIVPILLDSYAAGRREADGLGLSVEACTRLIRRSGEALEAARAKVANPP